MSNKDQLNKVALTTTENIAKEFLITSTSSIVEGFAKTLPFAETAIALTQVYSNFKSAKTQQQLLAFIKEAENINHGFIENFFQDKNNTEIGLEILGILDQTYLEHQAKMIGRITILFHNKKISKSDFDKFTYITTKLNNHLINIIENLYKSEKDIKSNPTLLKNGGLANAIEVTLLASNPNMDLISFGFLEEIPSTLYPGNTQITKFKRTIKFYDFYENIFKD